MPNLLFFEWEKDNGGYRIEEQARHDEVIRVVPKEEYGRLAPMVRTMPIEDQNTLSIKEMWERDSTERYFGDRQRLYLVPIGRTTLRYRPLEEHSGMFREFGCNDHSPDAAIDFTHKYGFISNHGGRLAIQEWCWKSAIMGRAISIWEEGQGKNDLSELIESFIWTPFRTTDVVFHRTQDESHPALYLRPSNLLCAMWLQLALAVSSKTEFRKCLHCPAWFSFGPGGNRRKTALYCSARCRRAAHRPKEKRR